MMSDRQTIASPSPSDALADRIQNRDAALRLSLVPGVGPRTYQHLLTQFGSAASVLSAQPAELRKVEGVGSKVASAIAMANENIDVTPQLELCAANEIEILDRASDNYPQRLSEIYDPPNVLFLQGQLRPENSIAIAIVGSRHATSYGIRMAENLGRSMAMAGFTVVSGLARGIDAAAHRGALQAGGLTIAVLGSGLLNVYPAEHANLALEIRKQGAVVSEFLPNQAPKSGAFPQRNRIVTGLSLGVVVVEAADRSGALISARLANEQGREVFAVPGRANSRMSRGCHALIKDGAKLVESVDDILEELGPLATPARIDSDQTIRHPAELQLTEQESLVLQHIDVDPTDIDLVVKNPVCRSRVFYPPSASWKYDDSFDA